MPTRPFIAVHSQIPHLALLRACQQRACARVGVYMRSCVRLVACVSIRSTPLGGGGCATMCECNDDASRDDQSASLLASTAVYPKPEYPLGILSNPLAQRPMGARTAPLFHQRRFSCEYPLCGVPPESLPATVPASDVRSIRSVRPSPVPPTVHTHRHCYRLCARVTFSRALATTWRSLPLTCGVELHVHRMDE